MKKKKASKAKKYSNRQTTGDLILQSTAGTLVFAVLGILMGIFFISLQNRNTPIPRSEAVAYEGEFEEYEIWRNSRDIHFTDGSSYSVYAHTETQAFQDRMTALEKGTKLYILVNPNNDLVVEIRTDMEELMNFEASQKEIASYDDGYVAIGIVACAGGLFLIFYAIVSSKSKKKEAARHSKRAKKQIEGQDDQAIRRVEPALKSKILLEATVGEFQICYRRVKHVNELVINGLVYDEMKAIIEFEHNLRAVIGEHTIEAGLDEDSHSYIIFDGNRVADKLRVI